MLVSRPLILPHHFVLATSLFSGPLLAAEQSTLRRAVAVFVGFALSRQPGTAFSRRLPGKPPLVSGWRLVRFIYCHSSRYNHIGHLVSQKLHGGRRFKRGVTQRLALTLGLHQPANRFLHAVGEQPHFCSTLVPGCQMGQHGVSCLPQIANPFTQPTGGLLAEAFQHPSLATSRFLHQFAQGLFVGLAFIG